MENKAIKREITRIAKHAWYYDLGSLICCVKKIEPKEDNKFYQSYLKWLESGATEYSLFKVKDIDSVRYLVELGLAEKVDLYTFRGNLVKIVIQTRVLRDYRFEDIQKHINKMFNFI